MFEQDYVMRLINEMVRAVLKIIFNIDTASPSAELLKDSEEEQTLDELIDMVDAGFINEAENRLYDITEERKKQDLEVALLFYSYLNNQSDEYLEEHGFSRDEVKSGLMDISKRYGVDGFVDAFLYM
ncbi:hypothetical protein bpr_III171 [Butyrivibrio proteoclasticus B316]|uniref:Uncharacterized protein n=1 Tax=Butyrivibrio proteoclasticus (strain ATCC 51982 / DSM 14932 / B316) TaxID=515622 RepID=E0S375_BUTPB|nr:DUF6483 family protein [Butyrivibrio proteoclasticus]ADL35857.1 hypothetical protein bpr_III171 [Butyrivibrio proteoclasticus B316]